MLRVATDCSGIEAPLEALARLGVPFEHVFASEAHRTAREWIRARWRPRTLYHDVTARAHAAAEGCDLYVAGPPCTPFSGLNHRPFDATRPSIARALAVLEHCVRYVEAKRPRAVVLENVPRLTTRGAAVYADLVARLRACGYRVHARVLSPEDFGCPQRRPRLYVVALRRRFEWPAPAPLRGRTCLDALLPARGPPPPPWMARQVAEAGAPPRARGLWSPNYHAYQRKGARPRSAPKLYADVAPALVAKQPGLYVNHERRLLSGREALHLQGFADGAPLALSDAVVRRLAGNAMNVCVLAHVLASVLRVPPPPPLPPLRALVRRASAPRPARTAP